MSQFVETRVGDFLGRTEPPTGAGVPLPRPVKKTEEVEEKIADDLSADQIFTF